ncbi:type II secretion system F family protein [Streptomyces sp. ST2-7A]|uniref:type II secretion system F family protein n=1 Tax=Streptomyces sp. ST2-7A TaxID=2907214 RepID=UPI001F2E13C1|nr:type II secretion system F family protein [Streptomyces sp. ST2-7A]MCE7080083.1 type II secretion system F family protein [Streptomyces sp. ST2-7A]
MTALPASSATVPPDTGAGLAASGGGGAALIICAAAVLLCVVGILIIVVLAAPRTGNRTPIRRNRIAPGEPRPDGPAPPGGGGTAGRAPSGDPDPARTPPRREPRWRARRARHDPRLPEAAGLLAACLAAGASPMAAAAAVGTALDGPLATALRRAAAELALGGDPDRVWSRLGESPDAARLARALHLADLSGAPVVRTVALLASEHRAREGRAARARVHRAGVLLTLPLGLCFLPAFLLIGVAPVVVGLARTLL